MPNESTPAKTTVKTPGDASALPSSVSTSAGSGAPPVSPPAPGSQLVVPATSAPPPCTHSKYFADIARRSGCPLDQIENFVRAGIILQSRQLIASAAARLCDLPEGPTALGFGGARGGGKTFWLCAQMGLDDCQRFPGLKCLLLRKVGKANAENFEDFRRRLFGRIPHKFSSTQGLLTFPNGSRIFTGHFRCEKDIDAYLGLEYDVIGIEEATTLTARKYHDIVTVCRTSKPGWRPRIYSTTNPGGVGHDWYRKLYVVPYLDHRRRHSLSPQPTEIPTTGGTACAASRPGRPATGPISPLSTINYQPSTSLNPLAAYWDGHTHTIFIPATIDNNTFTNPEYRQVLERLTGWQQRAWRDGDWDIAAGQFFTTFRREAHVLDDFDVNRAVAWYAALDYGFTHYTVVLLGCEDGDGNFFVVDEHAARGWVPERHAEAIKAMLQRHRVALTARYAAALRVFVAGTDVFARQSDGATIAKHYADLGINLRPALTDRVNGWAEILRRLGDPANSVPPRLFIHRRCSRLVDCLPSLQHDPNRPEDVLKVDPDDDGLGGDDPADALRYLVTAKPREIYAAKLRGL